LFDYLGNSEVYGGAIQSKNSNVSLNNSVFDNNFASTGGAVGPECISDCLYYYGNDTFSNNVAVIEGGAYYYPRFRPTFVNPHFLNN